MVVVAKFHAFQCLIIIFRVSLYLCLFFQTWYFVGPLSTIFPLTSFLYTLVHQIPLRSVPFRSVPFRSVPFHSIPFHSVLFRSTFQIVRSLKYSRTFVILLLLLARHFAQINITSCMYLSFKSLKQVEFFFSLSVITRCGDIVEVYFKESIEFHPASQVYKIRVYIYIYIYIYTYILKTPAYIYAYTESQLHYSRKLGYFTCWKFTTVNTPTC